MMFVLFEPFRLERILVPILVYQNPCVIVRGRFCASRPDYSKKNQPRRGAAELRP